MRYGRARRGARAALAAALLAVAGCGFDKPPSVVMQAGAEGPAVLPEEGGCDQSVALQLAWQLRNRLGWADDGYRINNGRVWIWHANEVYGMAVGVNDNVSPRNESQFTKECRAVLYDAVGTAQRNIVAAAL